MRRKKDTRDVSKLRIFEFGAGFSTLYWAAKAAVVVSVEDNPQWHDRIQSLLPGNARLHFATTQEEYVHVILQEDGLFDIVVIDGSYRAACAIAAARKVAPDGFIILDNADDHPEAAAYLRDQLLIEIDFAGFHPMNAHTGTTSLFLRPSFRPRYKSHPAPAHSLGHE